MGYGERDCVVLARDVLLTIGFCRNDPTGMNPNPLGIPEAPPHPGRPVFPARPPPPPRMVESPYDKG